MQFQVFFVYVFWNFFNKLLFFFHKNTLCVYCLFVRSIFLNNFPHIFSSKCKLFNNCFLFIGLLKALKPVLLIKGYIPSKFGAKHWKMFFTKGQEILNKIFAVLFAKIRTRREQSGFVHKINNCRNIMSLSYFNKKMFRILILFCSSDPLLPPNTWFMDGPLCIFCKMIYRK